MLIAPVRFNFCVPYPDYHLVHCLKNTSSRPNEEFFGSLQCVQSGWVADVGKNERRGLTRYGNGKLTVAIGTGSTGRSFENDRVHLQWLLLTAEATVLLLQ